MTGVAKVDQRHYDINGNSVLFTDLMKRVIDHHDVGGHRFRQVGTHQLGRMLQSFTDLGPDGITAEKRLRCKNLLKNYKSIPLE